VIAGGVVVAVVGLEFATNGALVTGETGSVIAIAVAFGDIHPPAIATSIIVTIINTASILSFICVPS
jgi:hypothetical protein